MERSDWPCRWVRIGVLVTSGIVLSRPTAGWAQAAGPPEPEVSLSEVLAFAARHAPALKIAAQRTGYARAVRAGAQPVFVSNPVLEGGAGPRFSGASGHDVDFFVSLQQPIEIAGERGRRFAAADKLGVQLDAESRLAEWQMRGEVMGLYRSAVVARQRLLIAHALVSFSEEMLSIAQRRLLAGDVGAIDVRLAETEAARVRHAELVAEQGLRSARLALCELTGWPIETPPLPHSELVTPAPVPALESVLQVASEHHPELRARRAAVDEAAARAELADREAWPKPVVGVQVAREGAAVGPASYIVLGTLGLPLPFWQRNQQERARARVDEDVAQAEEDAASVALRARITRAYSELSSALQRLSLFTSDAGPSFEKSLSLLQRGFEAGEIPLLDVLVARERFVAARRDALDAYSDYYAALSELEAAVGSQLEDIAPSSKAGTP